jgi:hypothetical protein
MYSHVRPAAINTNSILTARPAVALWISWDVSGGRLSAPRKSGQARGSAGARIAGTSIQGSMPIEEQSGVMIVDRVTGRGQSDCWQVDLNLGSLLIEE